jgi:ADP-heptose:LPS heptosyltransferase
MDYVYRRPAVRWLVGLYDWFGYRLFRSRNTNRTLPKQLTLLVLNQIGDAILCLPTIRGLIKLIPTARVTIVATEVSTQLLKAEFPKLEVISFDAQWQRVVKLTAGSDQSTARSAKAELTKLLKNSGLDTVVIFHPDLKVNQLIGQLKPRQSFGFTNAGGGFYLTEPVNFLSTGHQVERNFALARKVAATFQLPAPQLSSPSLDGSLPVQLVSDKLAQALIKPGQLVVVHPFARFETKAWSTSYWRRVLEYLVSHHYQPVIIGTAADKQLDFPIPGQAADWRGALSLAETAALCQLAKLFIGIDSGPGHIAAAVNCPVISIFSSVNEPSRWAPYPNQAKVTILHQPPVDRAGYPLEARELPAATVGNPYTDGITLELVIAAIKQQLS